MKKFIKWISVLVSACLLFTTLFGCSQQENGPVEPGQSGTSVTQSMLPPIEGTVHDYKISETGRYIVKNGQTDYNILVPADEADNVYIAAASKDLVNFFFEATGLTLQIVTDAVSLEGKKFLAIGDTLLASAESLGATADVLGNDGFRIKTVGDSVCMVGGNPQASMFAVYAFLENALGFEQFFTDFYALDENVTELPLMDYDVTDIPDFEYRIQNAGFIRYNDENRKRMRWTNETDLFIPATPGNENTVWHNSFVFLPPDEHRKDHDAWYSEPWRTTANSNQLCYTAHGIEAEYDEMCRIVAEKICQLYSLPEFADRDWLSVSIEDNQNCCTCKTCKAAKAKYGADSAVIVQFLNDVAAKVEAWMQTDAGKPYYRENFRIFFFAYHATNAAPVKYDAATDTYRPIDDSVICNEHVVPYFAETNGDYTQNYHDTGTANTEIGQNMRGWRALSDEIYFWSYSTNYSHFLTPYNSFDSVQDILKFAKNNDCLYVMIQDQWVQQNAETGFGIFKNWLHAKLLWDVNADVRALTKEFFDGYFREASNTMLLLYNTWRAWARYQTEELGYKGYRSVYINALNKDLWPHRMLTYWIGLTEQAQEKIALHRETDPTLYAELSSHIMIESLAFRYLLISLYADQYSAEDVKSMKESFASDILLSGMNLMSIDSKDTISALLDSWGV